MSQLHRLKYKPVPGEFKFRQPLVAETDRGNASSTGGHGCDIGPLGPDFLPPRFEYSSRYFRFFKAL